jgi:hypothetical protein
VLHPHRVAACLAERAAICRASASSAARIASIARLKRDYRCDEEAVGPAIETGRVAQAAEVAPDPDHRLLDGVLVQVRVPQHADGDGLQARVALKHQRFERLPVAVLRPDHEVAIHLSLCLRLRRPGLCYVWSPSPPDPSIIAPAADTKAKPDGDQVGRVVRPVNG